MRKTTRRSALILGILMMALLAVAVLGGCAKPKEAVLLRVNEVTHSVFYAPQYVAINKGYFEEENIKIELVNGGGSDKTMTAVLSGQAEVGLMGPETAVFVYNEGKQDHPVIIGQLTKRDGSFLIGRTEQPDFKWTDLAGKTIIGGRKGGMPQMTLEYVMRQNGVMPGVDADVQTNVQFDLMAGAFLGGDADYVTLFEPAASLFEKEQGGFIVASVGLASGEVPYTAYIATPAWLEANADLAERFLRAVHKGQKFVHENDARTIAEVILPSFPDTDIELMEQVVARYKDADSWTETPIMAEEAFDRLQTIIDEAGELKAKVPYADLVVNKYAEKVVK